MKRNSKLPKWFKAEIKAWGLAFMGLLTAYICVSANITDGRALFGFMVFAIYAVIVICKGLFNHG